MGILNENVKTAAFPLKFHHTLNKLAFWCRIHWEAGSYFLKQSLCAKISLHHTKTKNFIYLLNFKLYCSTSFVSQHHLNRFHTFWKITKVAIFSARQHHLIVLKMTLKEEIKISYSQFTITSFVCVSNKSGHAFKPFLFLVFLFVPFVFLFLCSRYQDIFSYFFLYPCCCHVTFKTAQKTMISRWPATNH